MQRASTQRAGTRRRVLTGVAYAVVWVLLALSLALVLFLQSSRTITVASHDAEIRPDLTGNVVVRTGPVLPDLRIESGSVVGVDVQLGKTDAPSTQALIDRYALLASQPDGPVTKVRGAIVDLALDALVRGAVLAVVPLLLWALVGAARRRQLVRRLPSRQGALVVLVVAVVVVGLWEPWNDEDELLESTREWVPLQTFLGPAVPVPAEVAGVEVRGDITTNQTRRLVESAVDTFDRSKSFYAGATEAAADIVTRTPEEGETIVTLVSDRHDNIGMDAVARAVGDAAGASAVFDAGDDTSTGQQWEAFSLDSVTAAFEDQDRWAVAGNHDNGTFVSRYLADLGWTMLDGEVVDGPGDTRILGVDDPRSSGLGTWRNETGLSFAEVGSRLADEACRSEEEGERVATILVHDVDLAQEALDRGCADLAVGGHVHTQEGPFEVTGSNGQVGHAFTTGTTGGAAYAIAIGSKLRRAAQITLITYADGRPVGLQPVILQTNGRFDVGEYVELTY